MPRGISLHVGINQPSSAFPNAAKLKGCENDAREMERIAVAKGFEQHDLLLGCDATYARVTAKIRAAAAQLEADDIFLFTFSGHGFQETDIADPEDPQDEDDRLDESLLLFDVELLDDVLRKELWPLFRAGVRVLMIADSCHSGSVFQILGDTEDISANDALSDDFPVATPASSVIRAISTSTGRQHRAEYGEFYRSLWLPILSPPINARLLLLAACEDFETTADGDPNGVYTAALLKVLRNSDPVDYDDLVTRIRAELPHQTPSIAVAGQDDSGVFKKQKPFTIN